MRHGLKALVIVAILVAPIGASADQIPILIGDKDGLGIGVKPDEIFQPGALPGYDGPGDGDGTDQWFFGGQAFAFTYTLPDFPINAARLEVFTGGQGYDAANLYGGALTSVYLNGTFIGQLTDGDIGANDNNIGRRDIFDLSPYIGLLTGSDTVFFRTPNSGDGWALDYAELTLQTRSLPEPGSLGLLGLGLAGLGIARRRKVN